MRCILFHCVTLILREYTADILATSDRFCYSFYHLSQTISFWGGVVPRPSLVYLSLTSAQRLSFLPIKLHQIIIVSISSAVQVFDIASIATRIGSPEFGDACRFATLVYEYRYNILYMPDSLGQI